MAETILSPGVLTNENDISQITQQPVSVGAALLGPTVLGKKNIPTIATSYSDFLSKFGGSFDSGSGAGLKQYSYLTSISAKNYFDNGGTTLLVTRIASGTFAPASASTLESTAFTGEIKTGVNELLSSISGVTGSAGTYAVSSSVTSGGGSPFTASITLSDATTVSSISCSGGTTGYFPSHTITITSQSVGYGAGTAGTDITITLNSLDLVTTQPFQLETLSDGDIMNSFSTETSNGALPSGTIDNYRWEIQAPNTSSGTFSLIIRRGDDTSNNKSVLETFTNLSLDPKSGNYISRVIGDRTQTLVGAGTTDVYLQTSGSFANSSRYVRVKSVNLNTPDFLDNNGTAKTQFTASIPVAQSGTFAGGAGAVYTGADSMHTNINSVRTQGLLGSNYDDAINLHANKDDFKYNLITAPGLYSADYGTQTSRLIEVVENRGDAMAIIDLVPYGSSIGAVTTQAVALDTSYAAAYWPWVQIADPNIGTLEFIPASTLIPGVYAYTDSVAEPWFAPAGINRGGLVSAVQAERKLSQANRDALYNDKVNPLATLPGRPVSVFGQKTLQTRPSALDRVNVRRLLIALKTFISQIADQLVFEQNTVATRNNFLAQVNPYLDSVQQRQGLFAFRVVMDESNNTPDVIDRNQLVGQIFIQPTRTAEFILLDFNILPTGAEFPS